MSAAAATLAAMSRNRGIGSVAARLWLFLSSYSPAFVIAAVRFDDLILRLTCIGLAIVGPAYAAVIWKVASHDQEPLRVTIHRSANLGAEVGAYLATYLLPLLTAPNPSPRDVISYVIYLVLAAVIYVQSGLIRINPVLYAFKFKVYEVETRSAATEYVVSRHRLNAGTNIDTVRMLGVLFTQGGPVDAIDE